MREYETMLVVKPDLPEADLTKMVARWESIVGTDGGEIIKKEMWGVKRLAYPILKNTRGNYFVYDVATHQNNIKELERIVKLDENVLRSMFIKLADKVNVADRRVQLQKQAEDAALRAAEAARERAEAESFSARRGDE